MMPESPTPTTVPSNPKTPFRILSLDGGGAKGFYTIGVLSEIEAMTGRRIHEVFDLIFGTSTGAIIAALLARGELVATVQAFYEAHVPTIMKGVNSTAKSKALDELARHVFKKQKADVFKTGVGIVATNWQDELPMIFKANVGQAHGSKGSFVPFFGCDVADAIIASCSAYPFFNRHTVRKSNGDIVEVADGGFCANNPTLYAIADALGPLGYAQDELRVVSIGVGSYPEPSIVKKLGRVFSGVGLLRHALNSGFLQKILGTNTCSMEVLRGKLFNRVPTIRISEPFVEPKMATDLLEHDLKKLNRLVQKGRMSFRPHEAELKKFLMD